MTLTKLPFWVVCLGATAIALAAFTAVIGGGRLSGPGISLALSVGALVWVARSRSSRTESLSRSSCRFWASRISGAA